MPEITDEQLTADARTIAKVTNDLEGALRSMKSAMGSVRV